jgi:hypothetical protein
MTFGINDTQQMTLCRYHEYDYAECRYAERRGAIIVFIIQNKQENIIKHIRAPAMDYFDLKKYFFISYFTLSTEDFSVAFTIKLMLVNHLEFLHALAGFSI